MTAVRHLARAVARRLADDHGFALVMAVGIMLVLTITVTSVISYTTSGTRTANLSAADQKAYALAEAGINNALSILSKTGTNSNALRPQPANAGDTNATVTTYVGGDTATWGASYTTSNRTWTIKSIGSSRNPTGPSAAPVTRTLYASAVVAAPPYSFVSLNSACEKHTLTVRSSGTLTVTNAMYTNSCNMTNDAFDVFGAGGSISAPDIRVVGGWETHDGNPVIVGGVTCPVLEGNPPAIGTPPAVTPPGCPLMGQPVLADPFVNVPAPALSATPACTSPAYGSAVSYTSLSTKPKLDAGATATGTTLTIINPSWVQNGDIIQIDTEQMVVTAGGGTITITVQRAFNGTAAAAHSNGREVKKIPVSTNGSAATPFPCEIPTGTVTLQPGTYYGGICIGAAPGSDCLGAKCTVTSPIVALPYSPTESLSNSINDTTTSIVLNGTSPIHIGDVIEIDSEWMQVTNIVDNGSGKSANSTITVVRAYEGTTAAPHSNGRAIKKVTAVDVPHVTMAPGTYIMAGGGFHVCGGGTLTAPNVLIYNTQDPTVTTGYGAIARVLLNTGGDVSLGPQVTGAYAGLTIFQDRNLGVLPNTACDSKGKSLDPVNYDIGFISMASSGANGPLGSVSGTIYSPNQRSLFVNSVSGRANLAVITSCILIDSGNAIFDFQLSGLFGVGLQLQKQWG